ncbi:MAG: hypothetical protein ACD_76C00014G0004 [uncultured bacterium]|nr:MAG: hypothetical protein ACD_76C00014G0004 [uncultured bacterium]HBD05484.1 tRNA (adenosine(37)-N6)-threonylcarbamoyltransferase complex ATPase subunit type 1 TsaE [Candidatus Uhrbacteria bacterium]
MKKIITKSAKETQSIAREFAKTLLGGEFIYLIGDLGAGKTTFVQGLASGLGADSTRVKSPTFVLMHEYPASAGSIKRLVHADGYRLKEMDMVEMELDEVCNLPDTVVVVEWPERLVAGNSECKVTHKIRFDVISENERGIEI